MSKKTLSVQPVLFHVARSVLVLVLLATGFFTILYWTYLMDLVYGQAMGVQDTTAHTFYGNNLQALSDAMPKVSADLSNNVIKSLVVAAVAIVFLLLLPRVRRYHKNLIITAALIMAFCFVVTAVAENTITSYMRDLKFSHNLYPDLNAKH